MEIFKVLELVNDFLSKTNNECLNCKKSYKPFSVNENKIIFECIECGLKITLED